MPDNRKSPDTHELTRAQRKILDTSVLIYGEQATKKDAAFIGVEQAVVSPAAISIKARPTGRSCR